MISEIVIGEMSGLTSLMGASAPPSQAPAANPQKMPSACRLRRRVAASESEQRALRLLPPAASTESIQKKKSAGEHDQRNPEVNVGGDGAEQAASLALSCALRHFALRRD
jgi:hypothetical protein